MVQQQGGGGGAFPSYYGSGTATKPYPYVSAPPAPKPKKAAAPKKKKVSGPRAPVVNTGGGGGGGGGGGYSNTAQRSGKSVGSNSTGRIAKTAAPPKPPPVPLTPDQWLAGDTVYKQQKGALSTALADYLSRSQNESEKYGITNAANRKALDLQRTQGRSDVENDYAARGMLGGAQQTALSNYDTDWTKRLGDFDTSFQNWKDDAATALADYTTQNTNALTKAQQEAAQRRAAKYGL